MRRFRCSCAIVAAASLSACSALHAQLRIVTYNIEADVNGDVAPNPGLDTVLQGIGSETVGHIARPLDILGLEETTSNSQTVAPIVTDLNNIYGAGTYVQSPVQGQENGNDPTTGNGPNALVYNTKTVQLISSVGIGPLSSSGELRQEMRYQFQPVGYGPSADFYVYVGHYKADSGTANQAKRNVEAQNVRADAATLPANSRIIYTGDFNLTSKTAEPSYATLTASAANGTGSLNPATAAVDPENANTSTAFYSESSTSLSIRFDYQFGTAGTASGHGFSVINSSYHTFGNNGTTPKNGAANSGSNTALAGMANRSGILSALTTASDHYPVVADYQLPASMQVAVGSISTPVIVGASVPVGVTVSNSASSGSFGADTLDYAVSSSGALTGSASFAGLQALAPGNVHTLALSTATPGVASGTVSVISSSPQVNNGTFAQKVSTTVLAHANPSFSSASQGSLTIDLGTRALNSAALGLGTPSASFSVQNLADVSGFTAGLDLDSIIGSGDTAQLATNLAAFSNLAAGSLNAFTASLNTGTFGSFSATYTLNLSDQNLPGAQKTAPLTLMLTGSVALAGDANQDGVVNASDFSAVAAHYGQTGQNWSDGDFNGDGIVNATDFNALAADFNQSASSAPSLGALVPEPAGVGLMVIAASAARRRSKRWR